MTIFRPIRYRRAALLAGAAFALAAEGVSTGAFAEEAAESEAAGAEAEAAAPGGEIVVEGIRGSLADALQVKRQSDSIVDAISAEDVGRFPDTNVAESVQRISGVQINRTRGEGRTVNIRGLPANFTLSTLNGRTLPNAFSFGSSRSFDFAILPPEFIRTLEVYKSPTADIDEGGLSGVVNIRTPRALTIGKRTFSASVQGQHESNSGKWAPRVSAFYADSLADGRLGISLGGSYTRRRPETHEATAGYLTSTEAGGIAAGSGPDDLNRDGVITPGRQVRILNSTFHTIYGEDNERYSGVASIDFRATDSLSFTADAFYSKVKVESVKQENIGFFNLATNGGATKTEVLEGVETATDYTVLDLDQRGGGRFEDRSSYVWSGVLGGKYQADGWTVALEGSYAKSAQRLNTLNIADIANGVARYVATPGTDLGSLYYLNGFDQRRLDPTSYRLASLNGALNQRAIDKLWDAKFDVRRDFDGGLLKAIRFGAKYVDRRQYQNNRQLNITAAGVSKLYGGLPAGARAGTFSAAPFMKLVKAGSGTFLGSYKGDAVFPTEWLGSDVRSFIAGFSDAELIAAGTYTNDATGIIDVREKTLAGYLRADLEAGRLTGNLGLRVVRTSQQTIGVVPDLNGITVESEAGQITRVPAASDLRVERSYWDVLPSLNLKFEANDELLFRFSASRTIARPNLMDISPTTTANGNQRTVTRNNPYLDPFRATNVDLTAEWYFQPDAVIGASLFFKRLQSLIRRETSVQALPVTFIKGTGNTTSTLDFTVSQLVNGGGVSVKGAEVYYQQAFTGLPAPFDGLGTILNYTFIDNSDPTQLTAASRHNFNAIGYYEKGPIGLRISYSWRDGFLSSVALPPAMSQTNRAFGTLDGSISFKINRNASITLEAVNILDTDEIAEFTTGLPASYLDAGRRLVVGARFNF
jgi:iron complex outermembrane receptor protein